MSDRAAARLVPPWIVPLLLLALVTMTGAKGRDEGAGGGGGIGFELGTIGLLLIGVVVGAAAVLAVGYLVLRWRAGPPPAEVPDDWWTCPTCGAANIVGSPRCHACGAWPR
jgi:hypothetical protein